jgi:hypothetical protein
VSRTTSAGPRLAARAAVPIKVKFVGLRSMFQKADPDLVSMATVLDSDER